MDAGTFLFRHIDDICWKKIEDADSPYELAGFVLQMWPGVECMLNGFIATKRKNPFIKRWHDIFLEIWKGTIEEGDVFITNDPYEVQVRRGLTFVLPGG